METRTPTEGGIKDDQIYTLGVGSSKSVAGVVDDDVEETAAVAALMRSNISGGGMVTK